MTIDTNIVIAFLDGTDKDVSDFLTKCRREGKPLFLSTVAEAETLGFSGLSVKELYETEVFLEENFISVAFDRTVSHIAAELRRTTRIKFPDAAIAATALYTHTPLLTRNVKDFQRIPNLLVVEV